LLEFLALFFLITSFLIYSKTGADDEEE